MQLKEKAKKEFWFGLKTYQVMAVQGLRADSEGKRHQHQHRGERFPTLGGY